MSLFEPGGAFVPNHQHLLVNAKLRNPPLTKEAVTDWLNRIVPSVEMEKLAGPFVCECYDAGNEGVTGVVILSTSHCSIHVWPQAEVPYANIDLYSCKEFQFSQFAPLLMEFDPISYEYAWVDRNNPLVMTPPCTVEVGNLTQSR